MRRQPRQRKQLCAATELLGRARVAAAMPTAAAAAEMLNPWRGRTAQPPAGVDHVDATDEAALGAAARRTVSRTHSPDGAVDAVVPPPFSRTAVARMYS